MILGLAHEGGRLRPVGEPLGDFEGLAWIDLLNPTADEETTLEAQLGVDVPTREEMQRLEVSGRLYREDDAVFMTATF
jgi:magnesium transporter